MSLPDPEQVRAALGLLKWENSDLAKLCGVSAQSVSNIKRGATRGQPRILAAMQKAFESHGVEFLDGSGVRLKRESVEILRGSDGFRALFDQIYAHASLHGGLICVSGVDETLFIKHQGDFAHPHMKRMAALAKKRKDFRMHILVREGDRNFVAARYARYRWQSAEGFSPTAFYVFGGNLALISFAGPDAPSVVLMRSSAFAEAYRKQFDTQWRHAKTPVIVNS